MNELCILEKRGKLIYHAVKLSTSSALLVCLVIAALFASSMLRYSTQMVVIGLFIAAMLSSIVSLALFLWEVYFAIETFEIGLPYRTRQQLPHGLSRSAEGQASSSGCGNVECLQVTKPAP